MKNHLRYILIDDDPVSNLISLFIIKKNLPEADVIIFDIPEDGLCYLEYGLIRPLPATVLLLDINMPHIDGWEFLKRYEKFSAQIQPPISIYMLSSSLYQQDRNRAQAKKYIKGFILKPFSADSIIATRQHWSIPYFNSP